MRRWHGPTPRERLGPAHFVTEVIDPLTTRVGDAWMRGQLPIFEEHLYTESVRVVLRIGMVALSFSACTNLNQVVEGVRAIAAIGQIRDELQAWHTRATRR